jgi:hypothetical protein
MLKKLVPVFCLLLIVGTLLACGSTTDTTNTPTSNTKSTSTSSNAQTQPTQPVKGDASNVTLGQPLVNFEARYGKYKQEGVGDYLFNNGAVTVMTTSSTDNQSMAILYSPNDNGWSSIDVAATSCRAFLPSDAKYNRTSAGTDGDTQRIYISQSASKMFSASEFLDEKGNVTTPGTIAIVYSPDPADASRVISCSIQVGAEGN